jgi:hypothetical protein
MPLDLCQRSHRRLSITGTSTACSVFGRSREPGDKWHSMNSYTLSSFCPYSVLLTWNWSLKLPVCAQNCFISGPLNPNPISSNDASTPNSVTHSQHCLHCLTVFNQHLHYTQVRTKQLYTFEGKDKRLSPSLNTMPLGLIGVVELHSL